MQIITFCILFCVTNFGIVTDGLSVRPGRANITYINKKYIDWATVHVKRYSRRGIYYVNLEGASKHTWGDNITEFLHNEYRASFIESHFKLCDLLCLKLNRGHGQYLGEIFTKFALPCPVPAGEYHLMNLTQPDIEFPYKFPFDEGRGDIKLRLSDTGDLIGEGYLEFKVINNY